MRVCMYGLKQTPKTPVTPESLGQWGIVFASPRAHSAAPDGALANPACSISSSDVYMTNEFMIRDSVIFSNSDRHLESPSNGSLTPVGSCSARLAPSRTIPEVRA
jgi:hypothetical protein